MLASVTSGALVGVEAVPVQVEVNAGERGEPKLIMVGLPDTAVRESNDRVYSALANSGFVPPRTRTTINLAPGTLRKEGPFYDLPIALGLLAATGQLKPDKLACYSIAGELSLSGKTRPVRGGLALARQAKAEGKLGVLLPEKSAREAALVDGLCVYPVQSLEQAFRFLNGETDLAELPSDYENLRRNGRCLTRIDFDEVKGQQAVRRAVEVAVAGGHNLLLIGPPGSGKSMIAKRIPSIMPEPDLDEFLEILAIKSAAGLTVAGENGHLAWQRPFRSPHHTITDAGLIGGGSQPGPGEVSLAHHGVLFLDELPEFRRSSLEVMRQPLEDGTVTISRSAAKVTLPCSIMLVAAMNPCPCGFLGSPQHSCRCTSREVQRYRARISGPLLDRIDIQIEAPALAVSELHRCSPGESSQTMRERIETAREVQRARFTDLGLKTNAAMGGPELRRHCALPVSSQRLLEQAIQELALSARAYDRILKVSRTIADLEGSSDVRAEHLLEAIQYRSLDRRIN